jgi:hypothetical protein
MKLIVFLMAAFAAVAQETPAVTSLGQVKRVYVGPLTGDHAADALRDLIISSIDSTRLFVLTDNPDRADAVLKGAADDSTFVDTYDTSSGASTHTSGGKSSAASGTARAGAYLGGGASQNESHHIKERKHEAYATVRLCNRDGDVLWSTTQESLGAKFRGASTDVAAKIARQLVLDMERSRSAGKP